VRRGTGSVYRRLQSLRFAAGRDRAAIVAFLRTRYPIDVPLATRFGLIARFVNITNHVRTYHTQAELLTVADRVLRLGWATGPHGASRRGGKAGAPPS
jgi:hypothetical protein